MPTRLNLYGIAAAVVFCLIVAGVGSHGFAISVTTADQSIPPEYAILESACWSIAVWNNARVGTGDLDPQGNMYWPGIDETMLFDQSLVVSYAGDQILTFFSIYNGSGSGVALIPLTPLTVTDTSSFTMASSQWATPDTVIIGTIRYYAPHHPDTCILLESLEICNNADTTVRLNLGEAFDWDVPDGSGGADNRSSTDFARQELYQFGPADSPTKDYTTGAAIDCFWSYSKPRDSKWTEAAVVLENDTWVEPNGGYDPLQIGELMATHSGFTASDPDSVENLNSFYIFARNLELEPGECYKACVVMASQLYGRTSLQQQIDKAAMWAFDHYVGCCNPPPICMPGDLYIDWSIDIDDVVFLIEYIFAGGYEPFPMLCCADVDASNAIDIDDIVYLISYIFSGGPEPIYNCDPEW